MTQNDGQVFFSNSDYEQQPEYVGCTKIMVFIINNGINYKEKNTPEKFPVNQFLIAWNMVYLSGFSNSALSFSSSS